MKVLKSRKRIERRLEQTRALMSTKLPSQNTLEQGCSSLCFRLEQHCSKCAQQPSKNPTPPETT